MEFKNYFNSEEAQLALFIKMAKKDGLFGGAEMMFLRLLAHKLKISTNNFEDILNNCDKYNYLPPTSQKDRFITLYTIIQMMKVDLSMKNEEVEFCLEIGKRLYIDENKMIDILELSKKQERKVVGYEEIEKVLLSVL